ncbi:MAG: diguanylate cyclase, partial [Phycisphaerales bacterium]
GAEFIFRVTSTRSGAVLGPLENQTFPNPEAAAAGAAAAIEKAQHAALLSRQHASEDIARIALPVGRNLGEHAAEIARAFRAEFSGEGMYVIENILLRPREPGQPFLAACADTDCAGCSMGDPYSYQLHFILPAFAGRFRSMDFRRFVEGTIRRECPAHILPRICWVNEADMRTIQTAYRAWLALSPETDPSDWAAATGALIAALTASKNVYPTQRLEGSGDQNNGPFVLGRTSLGDAE